jgi:hypothetical protein
MYNIFQTVKGKFSQKFVSISRIFAEKKFLFMFFMCLHMNSIFLDISIAK